jgi:hypothetical protein
MGPLGDVQHDVRRQMNDYTFTAPLVQTIIHQSAETVYELCSNPGQGFSVFERAPGLYCHGWNTTDGSRVLQWCQTPGFMAPDALATLEEAATVAQWRAAWSALHRVSKRVSVHIALEGTSPKLTGEWRNWYFGAKRYAEKQRIDLKKPYQLPYADEDWSPAVQRYYANREAPGWRTIWVNPHKKTVDDIFFLLALILLQERMIPEPEEVELRAIMVDYLRPLMPRCADGSIAHFVLDRLIDQFIEPDHWDGLKSYIKSYLSWYKRQLSWDSHTETSQVFTTLRQNVTGSGIAVGDALTSFKAEGLPATRSTLFRWTQDWAIQKPALACYDEDGRLWLTQAGIAEARLRLVCKDLTQGQIDDMGKEQGTARRFTTRHITDIREALKCGKTLQDIKAMLKLSRKDEKDNTDSRQAHMSRHGSEEALTVPPEEALKDYIAELEACKALATTPEASRHLIEAFEEAYEHLQQLQQGTPP